MFFLNIIFLVLFVFFLLGGFGLLSINVGLKARRYKTVASAFFCNVEIAGGAMALIAQLCLLLSASDLTTKDGFWIQVSAAMTIELMLLSICHLIEIRKFLSPPSAIFSFGILNLWMLKHMWYLVTEYEVTW